METVLTDSSRSKDVPKGTLPVVSVVIPVYNVRLFLPGLLKALRKQTLQNYELIFVDDGSADGSAEYLERAAQADGRVRLVRERHQNAGHARNTAVGLARGRFLCFMDADDLCDPDLLEKGTRRLEETGADIVIFRYYDLFPDGRVSRAAGYRDGWLRKVPDFAEGISFRDCPDVILLAGGPSVWNKMYRTSFVRTRGLRFDEIPAYNDIAFVMTANAAAEKIAFLDEAMYYYRWKRRDSISSSRGEQFCFMEYALESLEENIRLLPCAPEMRTGLRNAVLYYRIKTLFYDIDDYGSEEARGYYRRCRKLFRTPPYREIRREELAFSPGLYPLLEMVRRMSVGHLAMLRPGILGKMVYLRHRIRCGKGKQSP